MLIHRLYELLGGLLPVQKINHLAKRRAPRVDVLERLEDRLVMTVDVWTGAASNLWSDNGNWQDNSAPVGGEDLVFPSEASSLSNTNDIDNLTINSIEIDDSGYEISGSPITLTNGISTTYSSGTSTLYIGTTLTSTETFDIATGGTLDIAGAITVSSFLEGYGVTKAGGGTLQYSGTSGNYYNGTTTINAGTLILAKADNVVAANGSVIVGDNSTAATLQAMGSNQFWPGADVTVNEGSTFDVGATEQFISNLNLQGSTVEIADGGFLELFVGVNTFNTSNNVTSVIQGLGTLEIRNSMNTYTIADDADLDVELRISVAVTDTSNTGGFYKSGAGTLALSGSNTFNGDVAINEGVLLVESDNALGSTLGSTTVADGASVYLSGSVLTIAEDFSGVAGAGLGGTNLFEVISGDATLTGSIDMTGSLSVGAANGSTLTINGVIDDGASDFGLDIVNGSTGRTILGGNNLFDGNVVASSGFARVTTDNAFGDPSTSSAVEIQSGASLELAGGITLPSTKTIGISGLPVANTSKIVSISGDNTIQGSIPITGGNNQAFDVAGGTTLTIDGVISGARDFDKNNTGTLVLTNTNTNTGNVNVGDGTLLVNGSLATSNSVFVDGTLGGSGTVSNVTISGIGRLSPGNSAGILSTGDLSFQEGSTYSVEIDGDTAGTQYDQTNVTGTVDLGNTTLSLSLGYQPAVGSVFTIIDNDASDAVTSTFNGLAEGATFTIGSTPFQISYIGGTGNDVTLTSIARTDTWTGLGGDNNWSTAANWAGGIAPSAGDELVFPVGGARLSSVNDFASGTLFKSITIQDSGFTFTGNPIRLSNGVQTTYSSGTSTLSLPVILTANQAIDVATDGTLAITAAISGAYGLTKTGGGILSVSSLSSYSGDTTVSTGTLNLTSSLTLLGSGAVTVSSGATLGFDGSASLPNSLTIGGTGVDGNGALRTYGNSSSDVLTGSITLTSDLLVNVASQSQFAFNGAISGAYGITTKGGGTVSMSGNGANTFTGAFTQGNTFIVAAKSGGAIAIPGNLVLQSGTFLTQRDEQISDTSILTVNTGSEFDLLNSNEKIGGIVFNGGTVTSNSTVLTIKSGGTITTNAAATTAGLLGTIDLDGGTITIDVAQGTPANGNDLAIAATLRNGAIIKNGSGRLTLAPSISNTYAGGTTINAGTVQITKATSFGDGTVTVGDGSGTAGIVEVNLSGVNIVSNTFVFNTPVTTGLDVNSGTTTFNGGSTLNNDLGIDVASGASLHFAGPINDGGQAKSLTKRGTGSMMFSGVNTYTGTTFVDEGLLQLDCGIACVQGNITISGPGTAATVRELRANQIADGVTVNLANAGATLDLNGFDDVIGSLSITGGTVTTGAGTLTLASGGSITTLASSQTASFSGHLAFNGPNNFFNVAQGTTLSGVDFEVSAIISSYANIIKSGAGTMAFSGANTYEGGTNINSGVLAISNNTGAGTGVVNILGTGTLAVSGDITVANTLNIDSSGTAIRSSSGTNVLGGNFNMGGDTIVEVGTGSSLEITAAIDDASGNRSLTQSGTGTLVLSGTDTYTGSTTVNGTLSVNGSIASSSEVTVVSGAILHGTGTVPAVTVNSGGTVAPGNSPGILNTGDLTFSSGSTFSVEINGATAGTEYDQANVTGEVMLNGATLATSLGYSPAGDDSFTLINNDRGDAVTGTFAGLAEGATFTIGQTQFTITYVGGDGNDVVLKTNFAPTALALLNSTVEENAPSGTLVGAFSTTDGDSEDVFVYTLVAGTGSTDNELFAIDSNGDLRTAASFDFESQSTYSVRVRTTDTSGLDTENDFTITVLPVNDNPPAFTSSATFEVEENTTAVGTVVATDADLPEQTVNYTVSGGADSTLFNIDSATGLLSFITAPDYELPTDTGTNNVYKVNVTANDGSGLTTVQCITITVTPVNDNAPVYTSSATFEVEENATAVGTVVATDADLPEQTVNYTISGGADSTLFNIDSATGVLSFITAPDYELPTDTGANNVYKVNVTANDGSGLMTVQCITVTVTPVNDNAPVFTSSATFEVEENATAVGTVAATDEDLPEQAVTYSITGGSDSTLFSIDSATGVLSFITASDYELPADTGANNVYKVNVTANDNLGLTTVQCITVTVTPLNDNSPVFTSSATFEVEESSTAVGTVAASDGDLPEQTVTYSITGGVDSTFFNIDSATGVLSFITAPDYELPTDTGANNVYKVNVTANDSSGLTTVQCIAVTVTPVNDNAPVFTSTATFEVIENSTVVGTVIASDADLPGQTISYSITGGADSTLFSIDAATGVLAFITAPDYELPTDTGTNNVYDVDVTANDSSGATTIQSITVTVTPANDNAPSFTSSAAFEVVENTTAVGTVAATDAEVPGQTVTYSITGGADSTLFNIDSATGVLSFSTAPDYELPTDAGANNVYNVVVTASDSSGLTTIQSIAITVIPVNDNAPVFMSSTPFDVRSTATLDVAENSTAVGMIVATDEDLPGQTVTYSITGGADQALFTIDPATGALTFLAPPDFEHPADVGANNTYEVQITANDGAGLSTAQDLTVNVTNVVEAPVISLNPVDANYLLGKENAAVDPLANYQADVTATDYSSARLTVSITANRQPKDILSINPQGNKPGQINLKDKNVLFGGVVIGTFQGGTRSRPSLVISFNSAATETAVQALVKRITFFTKNERQASRASRTVQMQVTNVSGHDSNQATRVINVMGTV